MNIDRANQELGKLCSIPEDKRTESETGRIFELEQIIDHLTGVNNG